MSTIRDLLFNERYRGVVIWNRLQTFRNPHTGKKSGHCALKTTGSESKIPALRIVSDELWTKAHEQNKRMSEKHGPKRLGGMNRAQTVYLFSGLLECGLCGTNMTIVANSGKYARYGCPNQRFKGAV
ncbi:MAG: Recombinase [Acidobacteriales bacterium]|nr:Recombinase [Terriglobales bacterium]